MSSKRHEIEAVMGVLNGAATAAAVGAGMELGLFWLLADQSLDRDEIAEKLGLSPVRCGYWLALLTEAGLLERDGNGFRASATARGSVLGAYSQQTWALLAEEARARMQALCDLPRGLAADGPQHPRPDAISDAYSQMATDAHAARRFTRMLYEVHLPLAFELAPLIPMGGVSRMMDLGGGSGVVSIELARRYPQLSVTIVDLRNVCAAGVEIVAEQGMSRQISFHPADMLHDPLPTGFDLVLECDVNVYSEELFEKVRATLNPGGRYVIVDQLAPRQDDPAPGRANWALASSLRDPTYAPPSLPGVRSMLEEAGFLVAGIEPVDITRSRHSRFERDLVLIEAHLSTGTR